MVHCLEHLPPTSVTSSFPALVPVEFVVGVLACFERFSPVFFPSQIFPFQIANQSGQRILSKYYDQCKNFCHFSAVYVIRV